MSIWIAIHPRPQETRVLATLGVHHTLLKARLASPPRHPRALPMFLEAMALWQGNKVHAALVVDAQSISSGTTLFPNALDLVESTLLYQLDIVDGQRTRRRRDGIEGLGDFHDLKRTLLEEVAR